MNATTALGLSFLRGDVVTVKTAFRDFGISNIARECGRSIERKFGLRLARVKKVGKSRYGVPCWYYQYRLPKTGYNTEGRKRLMDYCERKSRKPETTQTPKSKNLTETKTEPRINKLF